MRKVSRREAEERARQWNCTYIETSAKNRQNVDEVFFGTLRKIRDRKKQMNQKSSKKKCVIL